MTCREAGPRRDRFLLNDAESNYHIFINFVYYENRLTRLSSRGTIFFTKVVFFSEAMYVERTPSCPTPVKELEFRAGSVEPRDRERTEVRGPRGALLHTPDPREVDDADPDIIPCLYGKPIKNEI